MREITTLEYNKADDESTRQEKNKILVDREIYYCVSSLVSVVVVSLAVSTSVSGMIYFFKFEILAGLPFLTFAAILKPVDWVLAPSPAGLPSPPTICFNPVLAFIPVCIMGTL